VALHGSLVDKPDLGILNEHILLLPAILAMTSLLSQKPPYLALLLTPEDLLFQRVRNLRHAPCHNQCVSKSSSGRIMAHENSTLGVKPGFLCKKSLFYGPVKSYFAVYDSVVLTGPDWRLP
jgi:hypothetical protein